MSRHVAVFLVCFAIGALAALILRTAGHKPYADGHVHDAPAATMAEAAQPMPTAPAATPETKSGHEQHAPAAAAVNTICAICGMPVRPALGTIMYKGSAIGFGCASCPPKFRADPAKYGEAALKNQVVEQP